MLGIKRGSTYVQVYDFRDEGDDNERQEHVEEPLVELGNSARLSGDGCADALDADDTESADQAADGKVDEHALLAVCRRDDDGDKDAADDDDAAKDQEARCQHHAFHVLNGVDGTLLWSVEGDDGGADDAIEAADLAHEAQALLQEDGRKDCRHNDRQGAHWGDQHRVGEQVGRKIAYLADDHQRHAGPPVHVLEVAIALARLLIVLFVGLEQAGLLEDEGDADEQARAESEHEADDLVGRRLGGIRGRGGSGVTGARVKAVGG